MLLKDKLSQIMKLPEVAITKGCARAELLLAKELAVDERVRMKCRLNVCGQYQQNLLCPPHLPELDQIKQMLENYTFAMLIQLTQSVPDENYREIFDKQKKEFTHMIIDLEKEAFRKGFTLAMGLAAGHCDLCTTCVAPAGSTICRNPSLARPSMEALGMNVEKICHQTGLPAGFIKGEVTLTGMLLID